MTDHSFSAEKAGSAEISTGESQDDEPLGKELDILKDLPSFNKDNFSRYTPCGGSLNKSQRPGYVWLKSWSRHDYKPQVIVMDSQSQILKELESMVAQQQMRIALKRSSSSRSGGGGDSQTESSSIGSCKVPRTERTISDSDSAESQASLDLHMH